MEQGFDDDDDDNDIAVSDTFLWSFIFACFLVDAFLPFVIHVGFCLYVLPLPSKKEEMTLRVTIYEAYTKDDSQRYR